MGLNNKKTERKPSMKKKLVFSLGSIAVVLIISGLISIIEYRRMSDYMSELIASNVKAINDSQKLYDMTQVYNNQMLGVVIRNDISLMPEFDLEAFKKQVSVLEKSATSDSYLPILNNVISSFTNYMNASLKFDEAFLADTVDTPDWFFGYLQPKYNELCNDINVLNAAVHAELQHNASDFDAGFYRSIIPGVVSVGAGLMLIFLLMYYIIVYYVNPIYRMSAGVDAYRSAGKKYGCEFEGDDQLSNINTGLTDVIEENMELKNRIKELKEDREKLFNTFNRS